MVLDGHNCTTCGQGLTRKSTALRHNNNLHSGSANFVRPLEYVVGRLNGKFLPSDPELYRRNTAIDPTPQPLNDTNRARLGPVKVDVLKAKNPNVNKQHTNFDYFMRSPVPLDPSHTTDDVKNADNIEKLSDNRMLNLIEFETLARRLYPPGIVGHMKLVAAIQANLGNDSALNRYLTFLRNLDKTRSRQ